MFYSTIQVLKVDAPLEKTSKKDGSKFMVHTAQTALIDDNGELQKVGSMRVPESLREKIKVGTFRAGFSLDVAGYGLNKGEIVAVITDLLPMPVRAAVKA